MGEEAAALSVVVATIRLMWQPFIGTEALSDGKLTRGQLRWNHAAVLPGVYRPKGADPTVHSNAMAAWLWTGRRGVVAGRAAAAFHGARWIDASTPIEIIAAHTRRRRGVIVHEERITVDEIVHFGDMAVTSVTRTALDLARHLPRDEAVVHLDALARATGVARNDILALAGRYRGARGIRRARTALTLMDAGAQSPEETRLRLLLIDAGLPAPRTQIRVSDGRDEAFIDMGYDEPMVGLDYEGSHHSENRDQYVYDIGRAAFINRQGWIDILVVKEHSRRFTLHRVYEAFARQAWTPPKSAPGS